MGFIIYPNYMKNISKLVFGFLLVSAFFVQSLAAQSSTLSANEYALTFFKKFNETQKNLTYMNKSSSLEKVGTETINGKISGTLYYDVKIKGMGAEVTLRYTNYSDESGWFFNGEVITHSNLAQNGTFSGIINVKGDAPGQIIFDNVVMKKGNPASGNYLVTMAGSPQAEVPYTVYLKSKE